MHADSLPSRPGARRRPRLAGGLLFVAAVLLAAFAPSHGAAPAPATCAGDGFGPEGAPVSLPVLKTHHYRMAGRVRLLLFWVRRDNVGSGRIVWRGSEGGDAGYELLIGTDPSIAPRKVNRWGYIAEEIRDGETRVLGVMSTSDEASLAEVRDRTAGGARHGRFKALQARVAANAVCATTGTIETERDLTLHDAPELVDRVTTELGGRRSNERSLPPGVRPGFLTAVAELVDRVVAASGAGGAAASPAGRTVTYVYNQKTLELMLDAVTPLGGSGARPAGAPVRAEFAIRSNGRRHDEFALEFATRGEMAGVPTRIRYQPRWWLQAELVLADDEALSRDAPARGQLANVQDVQHRGPAPGKQRE